MTPIDSLTEIIIGGAIAVHTELGPGLLESIYRECLLVELVAHGLAAECERRVPVYYRGRRVRDDLRVDLVVNDLVVVEVKAVERLHPVHVAQVITYLKLTGCPAGLLLNFNGTTLRSGLRRVKHPARYVRQNPPEEAEPATATPTGAGHKPVASPENGTTGSSQF
ncbi:MAG TPA: GxxExxY protein [Vicinamibacterales bacterium]|nr:GxxExxY protein [Vicinamibacterales bacterium]